MSGLRISALLVLVAVWAPAHDLYLMPAKFAVSPGDKLVISVHNGDAFPGSEGTTDPRRLMEARLSDGSVIDDFRTLGKGTHGIAEVRKKGLIWASLYTSPNFIELESFPFELYLTQEGLGHASDYRMSHKEGAKSGREVYSKFAKTLLVSGGSTCDGGFDKPLGMMIEFVPEANPAALKAGDSLPVRVLFRGKPAPGLQVEKAWVIPGEKQGKHAIVGKTDAVGRIQIPVDAAGKWRLHTVLMERLPADRKDAEWGSFWASMTFEVGGGSPASSRLR